MLQTINSELIRFGNMEGPPRRRRRHDPPVNPQDVNVEQQRVKNSLCCFCPLNLDVTNFEDHIQESENCRRLYMKLLKVSTVDGILIKTFDCIFCPARFYKLYDHLRNSVDCRDSYFNRYQVNNLK